jgi:hypothetical protein
LRTVVCIEPANLFALRKRSLRESADRIEAAHGRFKKCTLGAKRHRICEQRAYAVYVETTCGDIAAEVAELVEEFVELRARDDSALAIAMGVAHAYDADTPLDEWHPSLHSEAACVASALADIAGSNQIVVQGAFKDNCVLEDDRFCFHPAEDAITAQAVVALGLRVELAVLCSANPGIAVIGNFPALRPTLKAIEDMVASLLGGISGQGRQVVDAPNPLTADIFSTFKALIDYTVNQAIGKIIALFAECPELAGEKKLSTTATKLKSQLEDMKGELAAALENGIMEVPAAKFDEFHRELVVLQGEISSRIRQGDVVDGTPPFFDGLGRSWPE